MRDYFDNHALTSKQLMEHFVLGSPLTFQSVSMENSAGYYKDALRLGLPFHPDTAYLDHVHSQSLPCRQLSYFHFHAPIGACDYSLEPAFIQKRNERERHRVRCVNEGYARLREHLPQEFEDKRLSKVETLRAAIDYIKHLQSLLALNISGMQVSLEEARNRGAQRRRTACDGVGESKSNLSISGEIIF